MYLICTNILTILANFLGLIIQPFLKSISRDRRNTKIQGKSKEPWEKEASMPVAIAKQIGDRQPKFQPYYLNCSSPWMVPTVAGYKIMVILHFKVSTSQMQNSSGGLQCRLMIKCHDFSSSKGLSTKTITMVSNLGTCGSLARYTGCSAIRCKWAAAAIRLVDISQ